LGTSDYLTKPIDRDRLHATLAGYRPGQRCGTVLVVEDGEGTRDQVRRALEGNGCTVITAANGREALERLAKTRPDVILLDLLLLAALQIDAPLRSQVFAFLVGEVWFA
jgi:CheY-like chemotaxis protein